MELLEIFFLGFNPIYQIENREYSSTAAKFHSESAEIKVGVPQGSVMDPLLLVIFINYLPKILNSFEKAVLFADDKYFNK